MNKDVVSIVFGDSIVYGLHDKEKGGWVNRVRLKLEENKNNNFVLNLGIPGENSQNILLRFEDELKKRYNEQDEFKVIFSFGIKDTLLLNLDKNYLNIFINNVKKIISISKKYTKNIYFVGLIKPNIKIRKNYNLTNVSTIDNAIKILCKENNTKYISLKNKIGKEDLKDGLHPNSIGHEKICNIVLKRIYSYEE